MFNPALAFLRKATYYKQRSCLSKQFFTTTKSLLQQIPLVFDQNCYFATTYRHCSRIRLLLTKPINSEAIYYNNNLQTLQHTQCVVSTKRNASNRFVTTKTKSLYGC